MRIKIITSDFVGNINDHALIYLLTSKVKFLHFSQNCLNNFMAVLIQFWISYLWLPSPLVNNNSYAILTSKIKYEYHVMNVSVFSFPMKRSKFCGRNLMSRVIPNSVIPHSLLIWVWQTLWNRLFFCDKVCDADNDVFVG